MASSVATRRSDAVEDPVIELDYTGVKFEMDRGEARVLNDISLSVERGEILGIVGESGSGKSMCASAMLNAVVEPGLVTGAVRYYPPDRELLDELGADNAVDDESIDVLDLGTDALQRLRWEEISLVVQAADEAFNPTMTMEEHFRETIKHHDQDMEECMQRSRELLAEVHLPVERTMQSYPFELSGGMKQRALIALSLVFNPTVLVMDEPTATLDLLMQRSIVSLLYDLKEEYNLTLVFVTHDLPLVSDIADRIAVMYAFELIEVGPADELVFNGKHPYTRELINAVPSVDSDIRDMKPIPGKSPDPVHVPSGCSFHPRCPLADEQCKADDPPLDPVGPGHTAACFYVEKAVDEIPISIPDGSESGGEHE